LRLCETPKVAGDIIAFLLSFLANFVTGHAYFVFPKFITRLQYHHFLSFHILPEPGKFESDPLKYKHPIASPLGNGQTIDISKATSAKHELLRYSIMIFFFFIPLSFSLSPSNRGA